MSGDQQPIPVELDPTMHGLRTSLIQLASVTIVSVMERDYRVVKSSHGIIYNPHDAYVVGCRLGDPCPAAEEDLAHRNRWPISNV